VIVVFGDGGGFPSVQGSPAAPTSSIYRAIKKTARMLGVFPAGHVLEGRQRLVALKVNENYSSQIPSCWSTGHGAYPRPIPLINPPTHPPLPNELPQVNDRLQTVEELWAVKQCPHCHTIWNRDVNACR